MQEQERLSLREAADALGVSEVTARRWVKSGKLKAYQPGRKYLIPRGAIDELLESESGKVQAPSSQGKLFDNGVLEGRRAQLVRGSAHLQGTGKLEAAGERLRRVIRMVADGEISREEAEEQVGEILAELAAA